MGFNSRFKGLTVARLVEKVSMLFCIAYSAVPISAFCYAEKLNWLEQTAWELDEQDTRTHTNCIADRRGLLPQKADTGRNSWVTPTYIHSLLVWSRLPAEMGHDRMIFDFLIGGSPP